MSKGIYKITNTSNGVFYIGSSIEVEKRMQQHKSDLRHNNHHNHKLQNSFNKYGESSFTFEVIEYLRCDEKRLREIEQKYIDELKACKRGVGFNLSPTATGGTTLGERNYFYGKGHLLSGENNPFYGRKHSEETKELIREKNSGFNSPWFGRRHREESRKKISESNIGKEFSTDHRNHLSESVKFAYQEGRLKPGVFTEEARAKQKEKESIRVLMIDDDLNVIKEFHSITAAGEYIGVNPENITRVCKGKNATSGGYKWMYSTECTVKE